MALGILPVPAPVPFSEPDWLSPNIRQSPRVKPLVTRDRPTTSKAFEQTRAAFLQPAGAPRRYEKTWCQIGPILGKSSGVAELWQSLFLGLGFAYSDLLNLPDYWWPKPGDAVHNTRGKVRWTNASLRTRIRKTYAGRLHVASRVLGVVGHPTLPLWFVPMEVRQAYDIAVLRMRDLNADDFEELGITDVGQKARGAETRRVGIEAAHYAFIHGREGLAALHAAAEMDHAVGVRKLVDTWWRY